MIWIFFILVLFSVVIFLFMKEILKSPITTTFHGLVPNNVKMLEIDKIRAVIKSNDAFFANTQFARNQLTELGCEPGKIHVIPQGTKTRDFPYKERQVSQKEPVTLLSVGRLSIEKGFHIAIRAVAQLSDRFPSIHYYIIGGGLERQHLANLIKELGVEKVVTLCGTVSTSELLNHYTNAKIFILPSINLHDGSHTETQGVVLQEAQSSGIPVIASRTGGIPEVIKDGETGVLFDEEDHQQLANKIESLITDSHFYKTISQQAQKDVEDNFSRESICSRLIRVYQDILASRSDS